MLMWRTGYYDTQIYIGDDEYEATVTYETNGEETYIQRCEILNNNYELCLVEISPRQEHEIIEEINNDINDRLLYKEA